MQAYQHLFEIVLTQMENRGCNMCSTENMHPSTPITKLESTNYIDQLKILFIIQIYDHKNKNFNKLGATEFFL